MGAIITTKRLAIAAFFLLIGTPALAEPPLNQIKGLTAIRGRDSKLYYYESMSGKVFTTEHKIKGAPDLRCFAEIHPKINSCANWGNALANILKLPVEIAITTFVGFWSR